ncbi:hypothetical protein, partial [Pseudomonas viridiflava]|uniref:hypothetical protein n=1 Tax=Pseudomonas viridiflava TaxID=33069 RepID=UPI0013CE6EB1
MDTAGNGFTGFPAVSVLKLMFKRGRGQAAPYRATPGGAAKHVVSASGRSQQADDTAAAQGGEQQQAAGSDG